MCTRTFWLNANEEAKTFLDGKNDETGTVVDEKHDEERDSSSGTMKGQILFRGRKTSNALHMDNVITSLIITVTVKNEKVKNLLKRKGSHLQLWKLLYIPGQVQFQSHRALFCFINHEIKIELVSTIRIFLTQISKISLLRKVLHSIHLSGKF